VQEEKCRGAGRRSPCSIVWAINPPMESPRSEAQDGVDMRRKIQLLQFLTTNEL